MRSQLLAATLFAIAVGVLPGRPAFAAALDANGDGSVSMSEAHAAANRKFDALDPKHTGKVPAQQLSPIKEAMDEMTQHHDEQEVDKQQYMNAVDAAFKEADPKGSGELNAAALKTPAGKRFMSLVE